MSLTRQPYLINSSFRFFLVSTVLTTVSLQLAGLVSSIVVSNFVGPDALSAINATMPLTAILLAASVLLGTGVSLLVAKAMGRQQADRVNHLFTVSVIAATVVGLVLTVVLCLSLDTVTALLCPNSQIAPLVADYLRVFVPGETVPLLLMTVVGALVRSDGAPQTVTRAMATGAAVNVILALLLVGVFHTGIVGAAIATVANTLTGLLMASRHFLRPSSSYHWLLPRRQCIRTLLDIMADGLPLTLSNVMLGLISLGLNTAILHHLGTQGMFAWSVCLQLLNLAMVVLNSISTILFSIGGMLVGEQDYTGLRLLVRRSLRVVCGSLLALTLFILIAPQWVAQLFGTRTADEADYLSEALRLFSWVLLPYAYVSVMRSLFQVLGHRLMSTLLNLGQMGLLALVLLVFALCWPQVLWWAFPLSGALLLTIQLAYTCRTSRRDATLAPLTLIPQTTRNHSTDFSVPYRKEAISEALVRIRAFLDKCQIPTPTSTHIQICCEELILNIIEHSEGQVRHHHFDVHLLMDTEESLSLTIKDAGRPFNPLAHLAQGDEQLTIDRHFLFSTPHLGLRLVAAFCPDLTYKYMYGQNMIFAKFKFRPSLARSLGDVRRHLPEQESENHNKKEHR